MPLPKGGNTPWPPAEARASYILYGEHAAWYSGSPQELTRYYAGYAGQDRTGFFDPATTSQPYISVWRRFMFWAKQNPSATTRIRVHVPLAADIASTSSDLLFADPPEWLVPEAHVNRAKRAAKSAQDRLKELDELDNFQATFLQAGEVAAALGGVFLRPVWETDVADHPFLQVVHPDAAVPEWRFDRLSAVTFWRQVEADGATIFRHLERLEKGAIYHGLYRGDRHNLGEPVALTEVPATALLADSLSDGNEIKTGLPGLAAVYVPNMLPNRADRTSPLGRSDYAGSEGLMDALDETFTSWMRELRLGKARLLIPDEYMTSYGKGKGAGFDPDREIFEQLNINPQASGQEIRNVQFALRTKEHADTAMALVERIVAAAGYSGSTFGLADPAQRAERTATEVRAREHRSLVTREKKLQYFGSALADVLEMLLGIDHAVFKGPEPYRPRIDFPETVKESMLDRSQAIALLRKVGVLSVQISLQMAHPEWSPDEVAAEMARIRDEAALTDQGGAAVGSPRNASNSGDAGGSGSLPSPNDPALTMPPGSGGAVPPTDNLGPQPTN